MGWRGQAIAHLGRGHTAQFCAHLQGRARGVAQGEDGFELVALAHQGRQARQHLQVLRHADAGAAHAEGFLRMSRGQAIGNGHQAEAGERVVQGHVQHGFALGVQGDITAPQQQGVEQLAGVAAATTTARRQGLAAVVASAHDLVLRGAGLDPPAALLQQAVQQLPGVVVGQ